jgi:hypothetical protein
LARRRSTRRATSLGSTLRRRTAAARRNKGVEAAATTALLRPVLESTLSSSRSYTSRRAKERRMRAGFTEILIDDFASVSSYLSSKPPLLTLCSVDSLKPYANSCLFALRLRYRRRRLIEFLFLHRFLASPLVVRLTPALSRCRCRQSTTRLYDLHSCSAYRVNLESRRVLPVLHRCEGGVPSRHPALRTDLTPTDLRSRLRMSTVQRSPLPLPLLPLFPLFPFSLFIVISSIRYYRTF